MQLKFKGIFLGKHWTGPRIPKGIAGIQVNFCKNPLCLNYGRPASSEAQPRGSAIVGSKRDTYTVNSEPSGKVVLRCDLCGEKLPIKSNLAIHEEYCRLAAYLTPRQGATCSDEACRNHQIDISTPKAYHFFGWTTAGARRYRCRACGKTVSVSDNPISRQRLSNKNEEVFKLLVNKVPLKRMSELASVTMGTLYRKIDFIHRQCLAFAAANESRLPDLPIRRLYLSVDRQEHIINWVHADDKRNIILNALGTADNKSGYIFGVHVNYAPDIDAACVEREAMLIGDNDIHPPFRKYARVWLAQDYRNSLAKNRKRSVKNLLSDDIRAGYDMVQGREDVEDSDVQTGETILPYTGMQVHSEYTLYAHFRFLHDLFRNVEKTRFFMDQESGIRAACLSAFWQEVLEKRCDAFFVHIKSDLTINQKRKLVADAQREMDKLRESDPSFADLSDYDLRLIVIKERLRELAEIGKWHDRWLFYPFPDMSEPLKAICWLTDLHDQAYDDEHLALLYSKATLHGVDRFFMQARRRLSLLERPISSANNEGRKWYGYSPYNPAMVGKILEILRVFYNYIEIGEDKKTPAMRLGLTCKPILIHMVLHPVK